MILTLWWCRWWVLMTTSASAAEAKAGNPIESAKAHMIIVFIASSPTALISPSLDTTAVDPFGSGSPGQPDAASKGWLSRRHDLKKRGLLPAICAGGGKHHSRSVTAREER